jgi:hypothetical protein
MNVSHQDFIQVFSAMPKDISTSLNNQTLEDNECFTVRFHLGIFGNAKRHFYEFK